MFAKRSVKIIIINSNSAETVVKRHKFAPHKMSQATKSQVTLKGSAQMVSEFFNYGINSILYQRGIYPPGMLVFEF